MKDYEINKDGWVVMTPEANYYEEEILYPRLVANLYDAEVFLYYRMKCSRISASRRTEPSSW